MGNRAIGPGGDLFNLSQDLWRSVPTDLMYSRDRDLGWIMGDDFTNFAADAAVASGAGYYHSEGNSYKSYEYISSAGTTAGIIPTEAGWTVPTGFNVYTPNGQALLYAAGDVIPTPGAIQLKVASASDQIQLCCAPNAARASAAYAPGSFTPYPITSGRQGDVFFECRFLLDGLTTAFTTFFIGLANTLAVGTTVPCATTSFSTTPGYLGFGCLSTDLTGEIGMVWSKAGQAVQSQRMSATQTPLQLLTLGGITGVTPTTTPPTFPNVMVGGAGGVSTATPATYVGAYMKLGFWYQAAAKTLVPYINGIAQDGKLGPDRRVIATSGIQGSATYGYPGHSTLWPAAPMSFAAGIWQTGSTIQTMTIDWWRACQLAG